MQLSLQQNGTSALAIAKRLGYISVIDVLKLVTEETVSMVRSLAAAKALWVQGWHYVATIMTWK